MSRWLPVSRWLLMCSVNYLLLEAVDTYSVVCDDVMMSRDSQSVTLLAAAANIRRRLAAIFLLDSSNQRPLHAGLSICHSHSHVKRGQNPRPRRGRGQNHEVEAEAKSSRPRPRLSPAICRYFSLRTHGDNASNT